MKLDELAFFNRHLARMVSDGVSAEVSIRRLVEEMPKSGFREEMVALEKDLSGGMWWAEAVDRRKGLPDLYRKMIQLGVKSGKLGEVLLWAADYYQGLGAMARRLKGLMVYPMIVLIGAFVLSGFLLLVVRRMFAMLLEETNGLFWGNPVASSSLMGWLVFPLVLLGGLLVVVGLVGVVPGLRRWLRWKLPAFREMALAQVAGAMGMLLRSGVPLGEAVGWVRAMESGTPAEVELKEWEKNLAEGKKRWNEVADGGRVFPGHFVWWVNQSGEDLAEGFERVSEFYGERSKFQCEMLLYSALPVMVILLGGVLLVQIGAFMKFFSMFMTMLGGGWD